MTKRTLAYCAAVLMAGAGLYGACNDTITGQDCKVKCQDIDNTCVQKCNSDMQCRTVCSTDLDNCVASCGTVTATPPTNNNDAGGGG
ncbi:MAG TPA: hypothetical protein VKQ32_06575 [Polyangia bacterium]|nr:hypothetical protein [Polyangia bacterium]